MLDTLGITAIITLWIAVCALLFFTTIGQLVALIAGVISLIAIPIWAMLS